MKGNGWWKPRTKFIAAMDNLLCFVFLIFAFKNVAAGDYQAATFYAVMILTCQMPPIGHGEKDKDDDYDPYS